MPIRKMITVATPAFKANAHAALEAAHVGPVAIAIFELGLRLGIPDRLVARVLLLCEAEVDQRAMPCVAKRHAPQVFRALAGNSL